MIKWSFLTIWSYMHWIWSNGHFWPNHSDALFEQQCPLFSKPSLLNFLHGLKEHIKVIILILANHAETLLNAYNKNAKWQSNYRIKITPHLTSLCGLGLQSGLCLVKFQNVVILFLLLDCNFGNLFQAFESNSAWLVNSKLITLICSCQSCRKIRRFSLEKNGYWCPKWASE